MVLQMLSERDPDAFIAKVSEINRACKEMISSTSYDDIVRGCTQFYCDLILPGMAISRGMKLARLGREITALVNAELALTSKLRTTIQGVRGVLHPLQRSLAPLSTTMAELYKGIRGVARRGYDLLQKSFGIVAENPHLIESESSLAKAVERVAKIETEVEELGILDRLKDWARRAKHTEPKNAPGTFLEHQIEFELSEGKIIYTRDIGDPLLGGHAHPIDSIGYTDPVNHYNVRFQKKFRGRYERFYNYHIILDENMNVIECYGKYEGRFQYLNRR
jgi:hypothetical protein